MTEPSRGFVHTPQVGKDRARDARRYDAEMKAKAVRLAKDHLADYDTEWAAITAG